MKKAILIFLGVLCVRVSGAETVDISDRLEFHQLGLDWSAILQPSEVKMMDAFYSRLKSMKNRKAILAAIQTLDPVFAEDELRRIVYWKWMRPNDAHAKASLQYAFVYRAMILRDQIENPVYSTAEMKSAARQGYRDMVGTEFRSDRAFREAMKKAKSVADSLAGIEEPEAFASGIIASSAFSSLNSMASSLTQPYVLSSLGFVPGNRVELVSDNDRSPERIQWVNDRVIYNGGQIDWNAPFMVMPGVRGQAGHPVWKDPIFARIREMIDASRESVFINIFLCGGTMGATLARHLIDHALQQSQVNPEFRVVIMHDYATNYGLSKEMLPVFEYIRDRIKNEPKVAKVVTLLQANIQRHPPGIPFGITDYIPKNADVFKTIEKMDTYYESKIDHSKVIVVDPNSDRPKAYFGSKNWTDHSGSYYYDDAIYVEGPAASLVQRLYYEDVEAALTEDAKELEWFYFKDKGLDNRGYLSRRNEILRRFRVARTVFPSIGGDPVRFAEANVDGRIKNARNILVDMIRMARKNIYMEQLFLYDKYVVDALLKRKRQVPSLDVRILADHNGNFGMNGFPNTIFIKELQDAGIQVRARQTLGVPFTFPNGEKREFHQENHRKLTSVDGVVMLGGSSNLNPDTLQGSFREFGAQIFNRDQIGRFERIFLKDWADTEKTMDMSMNGWQFTMKGKAFTPRFSEILNAGMATVVRSKDFIEGRENAP